MKIKLSKKTKKAISVYIAALLILYIVVEVLPKVTDIFETTQVLEPGTLKVSYETKGYFIKDEYIGIAPESGKVQYLVGKGTAVKKGHPVVSVEAGEKSSKESRFSKYTDRLKGYEGLLEDYNAPISGVFSLTIDGYEEYFSIGNLDKIERDKVEQLSYGSVSLERDSVIKGEPVYKISADDKWYVLCWVGKDVVESYSEGREVSLELPEGTVDATVYSVKKDGSDYRVVFYLDVYYKAFCESRAEDMSIVTSDNEGLIVYNKCIVEKDGNKVCGTSIMGLMMLGAAKGDSIVIHVSLGATRSLSIVAATSDRSGRSDPECGKRAGDEELGSMRVWLRRLPPVPLPPRPPTLDAPVDLLVRQLPDPPPALGGRDTLEALAWLYLALPDAPQSAGED